MALSKPASKSERRRRIFLAARTKFVGSSARIRDRAAIKTVISKDPATFQSLKQSFGDIVVVDIIWSLLDSGIFESELKAKLAFPELYQPSPARNLQHDASEQEAAQSEAEALDEASRSDIDIYEHYQGDQRIDTAGVDTVEYSPNHTPSEPPSLFPSYLSYPSQHKLLNTVQRVLEDCCYDWATKWTPGLLKEQSWSCSEAVELSMWTKVLPRQSGALSVAATDCESGGALADTFRATHQLRHAAVHRLPTSVKGIERMLQNALNLATSLHDKKCMIKLNTIHMDFQATMQDMELHKNNLESQLDEELRDIEDQRKALDRKEKEAKLNMLQQDRENTDSISSLFEKSIRKLTSTDEDGASSAEHTDSGNVDPEESEADAVAGDTAHDPSAEHDETGAAEAEFYDAYSNVSIRRDTGPSLADPSEISEPPIEIENGAFSSELDIEDVDVPTQPTNQ